MPFLEQRKKLQATQTELSDIRTQHFNLTAELAGIKEKLLTAEQNQGNQTLDSNTEYQALTERYSELSIHSESIEVELAEQRALLRHALLSISTLSKEPAELRSSNEYKLIVQQLHAVMEAADESDVLENTAIGLTDKIESARSDSVTANKASIPALRHHILLSDCLFSVLRNKLRRLLL